MVSALIVAAGLGGNLMKALIALAVLTVSFAAHAKIIDSGNAPATAKAASNLIEPVPDLGAEEAVHPPPASNHEGAVRLVGIQPGSDSLPPIRETPISSPEHDASAGVARTLIKARYFSTSVALTWSAIFASLAIAGLIVWRAAIGLQQRYAESLDVRGPYRPPSMRKDRLDAEQPVRPLTGEQLLQFRRDGFLLLDSPQVAPVELASIGEMLSALFKARAGQDEGRLFEIGSKPGDDNGTLLQLFEPSRYERRLRRLACRDAALALARQVLGPGAILVGEHATLHQHCDSAVMPWHQDEALLDPAFDYREISVSVAVTDALEGNGAPRYVPGSHLGEVLPHRVVPGTNMIECATEPGSDEPRNCPVSAGSVLIHSGRTVHGCDRNSAGPDRLAYVMIFATPPVRRTDGRAFPWFDQLRVDRRTLPRAWGFGGEQNSPHIRGTLLYRKSCRVLERLLALRRRRIDAIPPAPEVGKQIG
jgi:hypothetical protein